MTNCLACAANEIERGAWIRVFYNSSRSEDEQAVRGKVVNVEGTKHGRLKVVFERKDNQRMTVHRNGKLLSHGSHAPITGYAYKYEVKNT